MSSLTGLVANYGDSDEEHDDHRPIPPRSVAVAPAMAAPVPETYENPSILPPPIPHCPWSACYDESSGFTYYWNQQTNAVTWEAPPEYLLALKVAQQQLHTQGAAEVSAEEWQLYQQALAEKQNSQNKAASKVPASKPGKKVESKEKPLSSKDNKTVRGKKRSASDDEDEKIELITTYYNSDSESNDESESPKKPSIPKKPTVPVVVSQPVKPSTVVPKPKKQKKQPPPVEYGPSLPPNVNYTVPIGPELPPELMNTNVTNDPVQEIVKEEEKQSPKTIENEDNQDEDLLLMKLKDKAKLLEKLGGEIPSELKEMINEVPSGTASPVKSETKKGADIDDLLAEIEEKELPKVKAKVKIDIFDDDSQSKHSPITSAKSSPMGTPPREEIKPLFPSSTAIVAEEIPTVLFPSAANTPKQENGIDSPKPKSDTPPPPEKKPNVYLSDASEVPTTSRKKFRISNSVLPERPKAETPSYTTKYSSHIEGFSSERTGLGFSKEEESESTSKPTISYGNGLLFTKGEVLNEEKKDEELDDLAELVEAKLKYLSQVQPCVVTPVQEMLIQMQTLAGAWRVGALGAGYWRRWVRAGAGELARQEAGAAPPGWTCAFQRSAGRYQYVRAADGLAQWDYPLPPSDMDISTTPPHPGIDQELVVNPPLPPPPPPPPAAPAPPPPPPPPPPPRPRTPPPPSWNDPPPPGTDDATPPPLPSPPAPVNPPLPPKQEIGDELASFYSDLAELEKQAPPPPPPATPPPAPATPPLPATTAPLPLSLPLSLPLPLPDNEEKKDKDREKTKKKTKVSSFKHRHRCMSDEKKVKEKSKKKTEKETEKKTKVKISSSIGMKHKSVSSLVAKWQQVAEEINSD